MEGKQLLSYQPDYYKKSKIMENTNNANALELRRFSNEVANTERQFFIDTIDSCLPRLEKELGLVSYTRQDLSYRRAHIISKLMGQGTSTVNAIETVAANFSKGDVEVTEFFEEYYFRVKMQCVQGVSPLMYELTKALEDIKPSHLGMAFLFSYEAPKPAPIYLGLQSSIGIYIHVEPYQAGSYESESKAKVLVMSTFGIRVETEAF